MADLKASRSRTDHPKTILKKLILNKKAILGFTDFSVTKDIESHVNPYQLVYIKEKK
jgi:hypothetical protein